MYIWAFVEPCRPPREVLLRLSGIRLGVVVSHLAALGQHHIIVHSEFSAVELVLACHLGAVVQTGNLERLDGMVVVDMVTRGVALVWVLVNIVRVLLVVSATAATVTASAVKLAVWLLDDGLRLHFPHACYYQFPFVLPRPQLFCLHPYC